jgi:hypothetical protein
MHAQRRQGRPSSLLALERGRPTEVHQRLRLGLLWGAPILYGAALRLIWARGHFHVAVSDELAYHDLAAQLVAGEPYGLPFWPPGWPAILALVYTLFGVEPQVGLWLNFTLSILTLALTGAITSRIFGRTAAIWSLWLAALMPSLILPVVLLRYEVWLQFLLALGMWASLWMIAPWRWATMAALVTTLATLVRPLWLPLPLLLWLIGRERKATRLRLIHLAGAQIGATLLLVPWLWSASVTAGHFVPVALNGGINLWIGNNPNATGAYINPPPTYWDPRLDAQIRAEAIGYMVEHPLRTAWLLVKKLWYSLDREPWVEWVFLATRAPLDERIQPMMQQIADLYYWIILAAALGSVAWALAAGRARWLLPLVLLLCAIASQLPFFGTPRFRWTAQFLLIVYAAAFPVLLRQRAEPGEWLSHRPRVANSSPPEVH